MQDSFYRTVMLFLFAFIGMLMGIFIMPYLEKNGIRLTLGVAFSLTSAIIMPALLAYIFRQRKMLKALAKAKERTEAGFVVNTLHELIGKLKEKESELEKLKTFAEEKAVSIEAYSENILQSVPSGVISIDNDLKIKSMNQAAEHILGVNAGEAIGSNFTETFHEPLTTLVKEHRTVSRVEYQYVTGDNRHIWLGITTSELKNAAGEKIGFIFVFTDLSDIKALQAQVELKERLSQLGEMSAGISHELRNSMSVISGYAKLLGRKVDQSSRPTVDAITEEIKNMDRIIFELLAFAKPTVLSMDNVDLHELIKEVTAAVIGNSETLKMSIRADAPLSIRADAVLLRQALSNLIINAGEAMPGGGNIAIELRRIQNNAEISIRDSGCGIPESIRQKIFLPFYTTKPQGTGFGLALVQKIVVSHGGSIGVESKEGEGTVFTLILPCNQDVTS
jgi:PAS domain S-box-containing protein